MATLQLFTHRFYLDASLILYSVSLCHVHNRSTLLMIISLATMLNTSTSKKFLLTMPVAPQRKESPFHYTDPTPLSIPIFLTIY